MASRLVRMCAALALAATLSACASMNELALFQGGFWDNSVFVGSDEAELGIAELTKGNYITAENHFKTALKSNPKDVHALIGAGILYQNTGQTTKAREMYEAVLALRPSDADQFIVLQDVSTRPVAEIASVNLALIESGGVTGAMTGDAPASAASMNAMPGIQAGMMSGRQAGGMMQMPGAVQPMAVGQAPMDMSGPMMFSPNDANIVSRFTTLRALRDQGLITPDEFAQRRQANIGALLPLTSPPPAAGLGRPVPGTEEVSSRLTAIGRALQMRAVSVTQHASERTMILDALMPSAPTMVMHAAAPPQGLLQAADSVRRLEKLREDGFITSDEYVRERAAIESAIQMTPTGVPASEAQMAPAMAMAEDAMAEDGAPAAAGGMSGRPAIHLASYKSRKNADRGWTQLRRAHAAQLDGLTYMVNRVDLGSKGVFHRLIAGPLNSRAAAADLCRDLKRRRQFCEPSVMP